MSLPCVLVAGGGTGGHVFPALSVADALRALAPVEVVFCGTPRGVEAKVVPAAGWPLELLDVAPMQGGGASRAVRGTIVAGVATLRSFGVVRRWRPRAVLSVGGYASGPVSLAAALIGIPIALLETNSVVGLANRILAPFAWRAYVAYASAARRFPKSARRDFGVPLRRGFAPQAYVPREVPRVLVMGGSQGALALNDLVPQALGTLRERRAFDVVHQAGRGRDHAVRTAYERVKVRAVVTEFIDQPARAMADADLIISRSGAATLAELAVIGRAALLVPFPYATEDHQRRNAEEVAAVGAAVCVLQSGASVSRLAGEIDRLLADPILRTSMAEASARRGRPSAAEDVARDFLGLAGIALQANRDDRSEGSTTAEKNLLECGRGVA
jgi:UDP-N-acetylglucosamine--N-acetylmuramyl-(pentapeptide) pyrophosphoryl-undecaprenol N-acetylglucosamine transferase